MFKNKIYKKEWIFKIVFFFFSHFEAIERSWKKSTSFFPQKKEKKIEQYLNFDSD